MATIETKYPFIGCIETRTGGRDENQDAAGFVDTPLGLLLVVCDGMGGGPGGRTASLVAVNTILDNLEQAPLTTPRDQALRSAIDKANEAVYSLAKDTPELRGMGTTVAAVIVNEQSAFIAHVGDTRVYLLRKGAVIYKSNDHSYVADLVKESKLTEEEARNHPRSNVITRALGIRPEVETEIEEIPFQRGDRFILCTDGIWGAMPKEELVGALSQAMGIAELTAQVTEQIDLLGFEAGGKHDNMTLAVLDTSFDSAVKNVPKNVPKIVEKNVPKNVEENVEKKVVVTAPDKMEPPQRRSISKPLEIILMLAALVLIAALAVYVYRSFNPTGKDRQLIQNEVVDETGQEDGLQEDFETDSPQLANPQGASPKGIPLDGKVAKEIRKKIGDIQIGSIMNHLDHLKLLEGKDREDLRRIKTQYVKEQILPDLARLEKKMDETNKPVFDQIREMLADNKTVNAASNGKSTRESNDYIDEIKKLLKKLRE